MCFQPQSVLHLSHPPYSLLDLFFPSSVSCSSLPCCFYFFTPCSSTFSCVFWPLFLLPAPSPCLLSLVLHTLSLATSRRQQRETPYLDSCGGGDAVKPDFVYPRTLSGENTPYLLLSVSNEMGVSNACSGVTGQTGKHTGKLFFILLLYTVRLGWFSFPRKQTCSHFLHGSDFSVASTGLR